MSQKTLPAHQTMLPFELPTMMIPAIKIPQPDGSVMIKAGRPIEVGGNISTLEASKILGISDRRVQYLCQIGNFETAFKPGGTPRSNWRISRTEVLARIGTLAAS
jgi:hypothetical protein